jgi:predicted nucleotidyltransferase
MNMLKVEKDFEEFIELLNKHNVEYMIVGAYALALYARPRNTGDLDIFVGRTETNADLILKALNDFGFDSAGLTKKDFLTEGRFVQLGISPVRIDLMNSIDGIAFEDAYARTAKVRFGNTSANFISKDDLIKNKSASARKKDQADLEELQQGHD